jgi:hypothetical protein
MSASLIAHLPDVDLEYFNRSGLERELTRVSELMPEARERFQARRGRTKNPKLRASVCERTFSP